METHMEDDEGSAVACGESWDGFENTILSSRGFTAGFSQEYLIIKK
jgi:hypothetical protein